LARQLLRSHAFAACAVLCALISPHVFPFAVAARAQEMRISHQFPAEIDSRDRAVRVFIAEALKRAPHLRFSLHPALELGIDAVGQFDAMARGELEMSVYPLTYAVPKVPELAIAWFPFIPADLDMAARLKGTPFHRKLQSLAEANGVHIVTWWWMPGGIATRQREIGGPQTVKGLSIRFADASFERLFVQAGARSASFVPTPQVADALREGKIDGVLTSAESLLSFRIYEHTKYATFGGVGSMMLLVPLLMSKTAWDGLTVDEKSAIEEAADVSDAAFESMQRDVEQKAVGLFTQAGAKVRALDIDEYEAWSSIAKGTVWPQYRKLGPAADGLFVALLSSIIQSGNAGRPTPAPSAAQRN
jgi:TRAP-type C4-dicarboxylate transport system substrate-binding protein